MGEESLCDFQGAAVTGVGTWVPGRVGGGAGVGSSESGDGPEDELLVKGCGTAVEGAADQIRVAVPQVGWCQDPAGEDTVGEARRGVFNFLLHAVAIR